MAAQGRYAGSGAYYSRSYSRGYGRSGAPAPSRSVQNRERTAAGRNYGGGRGYRQPYSYGSEAVKLEPVPYVPATRRRPARRPDTSETNAEVMRNREKASRMNPALIAFLVSIVAIMGAFLIQYISLQAKVTQAGEEISALESQLTTIRSKNDETLSEIEADVNLDEIKYSAITELGMTYAKEDQIISYTNDDSDYVHQVTEVGSE